MTLSSLKYKAAEKTFSYDKRISHGIVSFKASISAPWECFVAVLSKKGKTGSIFPIKHKEQEIAF